MVISVLITVDGDQCAYVSTVRRWVRRFKDGELGQADLSDKTRSGRPVTDLKI
jgi:transposase